MGAIKAIVVVSLFSFTFAERNRGSCPRSCIDIMNQRNTVPRLGRGVPHHGVVNYNLIEAMIARKFSEWEAKMEKKLKTLTNSSAKAVKDIKLDIEKETKDQKKRMRRNFKRLKIRTNSEIGLIKADLEGRLQKNFTRWMDTMGSQIEEIKADVSKRENDFEERLQENITRRMDSMGSEIEEIKADFSKRETELKTLVISLLPVSCEEAGRRNDGIVKIQRNGKIYEVYCDMSTDGGNWMVFQRRMNGSVDFYRTWEEYASGFGNKYGEFWLGLETIHQLTKDGEYELRVDLTDWDGSIAYARYATFSVSGRSDGYRLTVQGYSGTAGDSMHRHNGRRFSAKDKDLDPCECHCATLSHGAWWYDVCSTSNLNGKYDDTVDYYHGIFWGLWKGYRHSLKATEMKLRKK